MAPRRGGGSSGGGGTSSSCYNCNAPLTLYGSDWQSGRTTGIFVVEIIVIIVLLVCLFLSTRFTWFRERGTDKLRNIGYKIAVCSALISYILNVTDIGLRESETDATYLYYLTNIFSSFFWRLSDVLIIAIILRINTESTTSVFRKLEPLHIAIVVLLGVLQAAAFGIYTAQMASIIQGDDGGYSYSYGSLYMSLGYVMIAYSALYFVAMILAAVEAVVVLLKDRSKATLLMVGVVIPSLFLYSLIRLVYYAINYNPGRYFYANANLTWAYIYISDLMTIGIYLGVVVVGFLYSRKNRGVKETYNPGYPTGYNPGFNPNYNSGYPPVPQQQQQQQQLPHGYGH